MVDLGVIQGLTKGKQKLQKGYQRGRKMSRKEYEAIRDTLVSQGLSGNIVTETEEGEQEPLSLGEIPGMARKGGAKMVTGEGGIGDKYQIARQEEDTLLGSGGITASQAQRLNEAFETDAFSKGLDSGIVERMISNIGEGEGITDTDTGDTTIDKDVNISQMSVSDINDNIESINTEMKNIQGKFKEAKRPNFRTHLEEIKKGDKRFSWFNLKKRFPQKWMQDEAMNYLDLQEQKRNLLDRLGGAESEDLMPKQGNWRDNLPPGVAAEDVEHTANKHNMTPEEVIQRLK